MAPPTRCITDDTYVSLPSQQRNTAQFKFNAFSFLPDYEVVYLQCEVALCKVGDPSSHCSQGCAGRGRSRRGAGEQAGRLQVLGPLEIHRGADGSRGVV